MIFVGLCEYFGCEFSETLLDIYFRALADMDIEQVETAAMKAVQSCKFFPKIVELRELLDGGAEERALVGWETLQRAVQQYGPYKSVMFADPRIARTVDAMGGWVEVNSWHTDEIKYRRAEFLKIYQAARSAEPYALPGIHETQNAARGYGVDGPVLVSDGHRPLLLN